MCGVVAVLRRRSSAPLPMPPRYGALVDAVTETTPEFDDDRLGTLAVIDLLTPSRLRTCRILAHLSFPVLSEGPAPWRTTRGA